MDLADAVLKVMDKRKELGGTILDFGAGSWLRYTKRVQGTYSGQELYAVEYEEAFHDKAKMLRDSMQNDVTFWRPFDFVMQKKQRFDLALLINVLNTIPEESQRQSIFKAVADRLNPLGWLVVYQRNWSESDKPDGALEYTDGWMVRQQDGSYTYRARTGARWFNDQARECKLRDVQKGIAPPSSNNALLRVWEKPFDI
jgi:hypothetical protein